jgi:hypothetical protein
MRKEDKTIKSDCMSISHELATEEATMTFARGLEFAEVCDFNEQVIQMPIKTSFEFLDGDRYRWFKNVVNEELDELKVALCSSDPAGCIDAVIDLIYFAYGRLYEMGVTYDQFCDCWEAVHEANMKKVLGNKGRGSDQDAIKPEGWESPEKNFATINFKDGELSPETKSMIRAIDETATPGGMISAHVDDIKKQDFINEIWPEKLKYHKPEPDPTQGMKFDNGKLPVGQFIRDFKYAILEVTKIWAFGANKYAKGNWKHLLGGEDRYGDAEIRHFLEGDTLDEESKILHAAHKAWNALAELSFILKRKNGVEL